MSTSPERSDRIDFIDGLRGLAMLLVLCLHHWDFTGREAWQIGPFHFDRPFFFSSTGVNLFLVISGFCLAWPYSGPTGKSLAKLSFTKFLQRRFRRLAPAYYVVLALSALPVLLAAWAKTGTIATHYWLDLLAHMFWVHNLSGAYLHGFNEPMWSLGLEFQLYLLFPLFLWFKERFGTVRLLLVIGSLEVAYRIAILPLLSVEDWTTNFSLAYAVPGRMFEFVAGIAVAEFVRRSPATHFSAKARWGTILLWAGIGYVAGWIAVVVGKYHPAFDLLCGAFFGLTLLLGFMLPAWRSVLGSKPLLFLGVCSYSVYLIHGPVGIWLRYHFYFQEHIPILLRLTMMVLYPLLMIAIGWLFYTWLEKPFLKPKT